MRHRRRLLLSYTLTACFLALLVWGGISGYRESNRLAIIRTGIAECQIYPEAEVLSLKRRGESVLGYKNTTTGGIAYTCLRLSNNSSSRELPEWLSDLIVGTQLQTLRIEHRSFHNDDLKSLLNCKSLTKIELFDCDIGGTELVSGTQEFSGNLTISNCRFAPSFLPAFVRAQRVWLLDSVISDKQVTAICMAGNQLREFASTEPIATQAIEHLLRKPRLEVLDLSRQCFKELNTQSTERVKYKIKMLKLTGCYPANDVAAFISQCPTLERCYLEGESADQVTVRSLLTSDATLMEVLVAGPLITDESIPLFRKRRQLRTLMIRDTSISHESFREFQAQFSGRIFGAPGRMALPEL